jgi:competence protein ComEC
MLSVPLFNGKKELFFALGVVFCIALISLGIEFYRYQIFSKLALHVKTATVLNHYQKTNEKGKTYDVIKLKLDSGEQMYTVSWKPLRIELKSRVKVKFELKSLSFKEYLSGFFAPSKFIYEIYEDNPPFDVRPLYRFVKEQHEESIMGELYSALLFATPLSKELRESVQKWGITHLVAISGYNVGVISFLLFFLLKPFYTFFQNRYFPYRNVTADLMPIIFLVLVGYMALIDYVPPFMRAVVMSVVGFFFFSRGVTLLSFELLAMVVLGILAFIPSLFFSLSFWFSIVGVFYLFLFLHHVKWKSKIGLFLGLDIFVFTAMLPIVHAFFSVFTPLQLTSPLWSAVFIVFYPLGLFLHVIVEGNLLDYCVLAFLHVKTQSYHLSVPYWFLIPYGVLSILSIWSRKLFILSFVLALGVFVFIE